MFVVDSLALALAFALAFDAFAFVSMKVFSVLDMCYSAAMGLQLVSEALVYACALRPRRDSLGS